LNVCNHGENILVSREGESPRVQYDYKATIALCFVISSAALALYNMSFIIKMKIVIGIGNRIFVSNFCTRCNCPINLVNDYD
jgi:hypothetical protein